MEDETAYSKSEIKKLVWTGPTVETGEGQVVHGVVGLARDGKFAAGLGTIHQERSLNNRIGYEVTSYQWQNQPYEHKEHAIFGAQTMEQIELRDRAAEPERLVPPAATPETRPARKPGVFEKLVERMGSRKGSEKPLPRQSRSIER